MITASTYAPGLHRLPEPEYRAADAAANSDLKLCLRSLAHFYAARLDPDREPEVVTPAKIAGRALHCAILEPHTFDDRFAYVPEDAPRDLRHYRDAKKPSEETVASVKWWDAFTERVAGKELMDRSTSEKVRRAGSRIAAHPELRAWLDVPGGTAEDSIFGIDPETGLLCKIRTDYRITTPGGLRVVIDLKSCEDARPEKFSWTALNYGYFQGAAFYCDVHEWAGLGAVDVYLLVAFERDNPGAGVKVYEVTGEEIDLGRSQYRRGLQLYQFARETQEYPGYSSGVERLRAPASAFK